MAIFVTSDQHFNHVNALNLMHDSRPFSSVNEMNEALINNWNEVVSKNDEVYVLGDFIMGAAEDVQPIIDRLNGRIHLIIGNHDTQSKLDIYKANDIDCQYGYVLKSHKIDIIMSHYPICDSLLDENYHDNRLPNRIFLYGHVHNEAPYGIHHCNCYHVGVDTNDLIPIKLDDIICQYKNLNK